MKASFIRFNISLLSYVALLGLAGCQGAFNPFDRPGTWAEAGAANETIAQQAAQKSDLISGESEPGSNGIIAVGGIEKAVTKGTAAGIQTPLTITSPATSISGGE
ncbi:MAG: hypothetical protein KGJ73_04875 [Rhodospirillales bacterium]|nr:hypothetical protein [Rhodospirillales bacterium]